MTPCAGRQGPRGSVVPSPPLGGGSGSAMRWCVPRSSALAARRTGPRPSADDLDADLAAHLDKLLLELWPRVVAVGVEREQERVGFEQGRHQQHASVAVLNAGGVDNGMHQQVLRVDENVALLAFDPGQSAALADLPMSKPGGSIERPLFRRS